MCALHVKLCILNFASSLLFIRWDVDPEIFNIYGISFRWYGLLFAAAFVFGYFIIWKIFIRESVPRSLLDHLVWYVAIGTLIGARMGHCLFYEPDYYIQNPSEIIKIWNGGLASHGAGIGILVVLYIFSRVEKRSYIWLLDRVAIVVALSGFFIRIGNLMNSEIYGIRTSLPWGFIFVRANETLPKHPTQIYEALSYLLIFVLLCFLYFKKKLYPGRLFGVFLFFLFLVRFCIEFIKEDQVAFEKNMFLNIGQLLSIPFMIVGIYFLIRKPKPKQEV